MGSGRWEFQFPASGSPEKSSAGRSRGGLRRRRRPWRLPRLRSVSTELETWWGWLENEGWPTYLFDFPATGSPEKSSAGELEERYVSDFSEVETEEKQGRVEKSMVGVTRKPLKTLKNSHQREKNRNLLNYESWVCGEVLLVLVDWSSWIYLRKQLGSIISESRGYRFGCFLNLCGKWGYFLLMEKRRVEQKFWILWWLFDVGSLLQVGLELGEETVNENERWVF